MLTGPLVFVDVDTQRDFLEPTGALYVHGAEAIRPNLARLTGFARTQGIPILATACAHAIDDPDPEPFPPHCLIGSRGQERVAETAWPGTVVVPRDGGFQGEIPPHLTICKRYYDVFTNPDAAPIVTMYNHNHPTFLVYGVATDYCVKATVHGLLSRGCRVAVGVDAIRAVKPAVEPDNLTEFIRRGAVLVMTDVISSNQSVAV
jgi:nicotinamidase/pyrazinamidase